MCAIPIKWHDWDWSESEGKRPKPTPLPHVRLWFIVIFPLIFQKKKTRKILTCILLTMRGFLRHLLILKSVMVIFIKRNVFFSIVIESIPRIKSELNNTKRFFIVEIMLF